jgi:microcystin-dependent protein
MASEPFLATVFIFAGNFAPRGYMLCQGQILAIASNTALFSLLGTTYGGNGQTTFALPDLRGRAPVGTGGGPGLSPIELGEVGGQQSTTLNVTQMPAHNHTAIVNAAADGRPANDSPADGVPDSTGTPQYAAAPDGATKMNAGMVTVGIAGGSQPFNIQDPFLGLNYIIATQGLFPSRN